MKSTTSIFAVAGLFILFFLAGRELWFKETLHDTSTRPDGAMRVEVYTLPSWSLKPAPGSGGDTSVIVYVKDHEGKVLERWTGLMLQTAGPTIWYSDCVNVGPRYFNYR